MLATPRLCRIAGPALPAFGLLLLGCGERDSDLIVAVAKEPEAPALSREVRDAIDERPLGGASLTSGTTGGGTYEAARAAGSLFRVATWEELRARVSGDEPAVVVIDAGTYRGEGSERTVQACRQPCEAEDPIAEQVVPASACREEEALFPVTVTSDLLRVGSNKTLIGLDEGARLENVRVSLQGSSNVILRNLAIVQLDPEVEAGGAALSLTPAHHVWLDHVTLSDVSHALLPILSTWDQDDDQALVEESGYITISHGDFDGFVENSCSQRSEQVLSTNRNPALTISRTWFRRARIRVPNLFGPGTWAHLYNNVWSDIDGRGLAVSCGAAAIAQGNVFQATHNALYNTDSGLPDWQFCSAGFYGVLYAPKDEGAEANLLDAASSQNLSGQPTSGEGLVPPRAVGSGEYELTVPVAGGAQTETYRMTLASDPTTVATEVPATAGVGHLF